MIKPEKELKEETRYSLLAHIKDKNGYVYSPKAQVQGQIGPPLNVI